MTTLYHLGDRLVNSGDTARILAITGTAYFYRRLLLLAHTRKNMFWSHFRQLHPAQRRSPDGLELLAKFEAVESICWDIAFFLRAFESCQGAVPKGSIPVDRYLIDRSTLLGPRLAWLRPESENRQRAADQIRHHFVQLLDGAWPTAFVRYHGSEIGWLEYAEGLGTDFADIWVEVTEG